MSTTNKLNVEIIYQNGGTRKYALNTGSSPNITQIKTRIGEINNHTGTGGNYVPAMQATFVDEDNSPMMKIASATYVVTTEEVIYGG